LEMELPVKETQKVAVRVHFAIGTHE
jgi:hypothetical protein